MFKVSFNELRLNLTTYCRNKEPKIYITKSNKIVGELKFYSDKELSELELETDKVLSTKTSQK